MKRLILFITFLAVYTHLSYAQEEANIVKVGDAMPSFTIISDDGKEWKSTELKGKVTLLTFFATWCPPCQKELAAIQETLWPTFKDNANFRLMVIGREHSDAELAGYNEKKGFTFPLYPDKNRAIYSKFANSLIPRVYLIGKDGKVVYAKTGYTEEDFATLMAKIKSLL